MKTRCRNTLTVLLIGVLTSCAPSRYDSDHRGLLMIVGGREKPAAAIAAFISHCGEGKILVIPSASAVPFESGPEAVSLFRAYGARSVDWLFISDSSMAGADSVVARVSSAAGIFFTGGVQTRLMQRIGGTPVAKAIRDLYLKKGGAVGGTSAGAAVMSSIMITGEGDFSVIRQGAVETAAGLGLLSNCIIDQHFIKRARHNRLMTLAIEKQLPGIGVDESTAILYYPDDTFTVTGEGSVIVYDPHGSSITTDKETGLLGADNIRVTLLHDGQRYDMKSAEYIDFIAY